VSAWAKGGAKVAHVLKILAGLSLCVPLAAAFAPGAAAASANTVYPGTAAQLSGATVHISTSRSGYEGSGYIAGFQNSPSDEAVFTVTVPVAGLYPLSMEYDAPYGDKINNIVVDGNPPAQIDFPQTSGFVLYNIGNVPLAAGTNTITFQANWGYMDVNNIQIGALVPPSTPPAVSSVPVDPYDTGNTLNLMKYLTSIYGHKTLSGQESGVYDELSYIQQQSGQLPAIQSFDLDQPDQMQSVVDQALAWGRAGGIVELSWHWVAPMDGASFYTDDTTFSAEDASTPGTPQYAAAMQDIDQVAGYLQQLAQAGIPVLFRPLLEANGGWFWWGASGPGPFQALWKMVYNQLVTVDHLNNLIWVYAAANTDNWSQWYPGNSEVDIVGDDQYLPGNDYDNSAILFSTLESDVDSQKMVALTESGTIPSETDAFADGADWLYWNIWNGRYIMQSAYDTTQHIDNAYNNPDVVTFADLPSSIYGYAPSAPNLPPVPQPQPVPAGYTPYDAAGATLIGSGPYVSSSNQGYIGPGYVTGLVPPSDLPPSETEDGLSVSVNAPNAGLYNLLIRMDAPYSAKTNELVINGAPVEPIATPQGNVFQDISAGNVALKAGENTVSLIAQQGYVNVDAFLLAQPANASVVNPVNLPGSGTAADPFQISTAAQLLAFDHDWMQYDAAYLELVADVSLPAASGASSSNWTPVGTLANPFSGTFDGQDHSISGLTLNNTGPGQVTSANIDATPVGLFGAVDGTIENVRLLAPNVVNSDPEQATGALAGVLGNLKGATGSSAELLDDVIVGGTVTSDGTTSAGGAALFGVGGLLGNNGLYFSVSGNSADLVNGIVAGSDSTAAVQSVAGNLDGEFTGEATNVGGLVGNNYSGTVSDSWAGGSVRGSGFAGGLIGQDNGNVQNAYSSASVAGADYSQGQLVTPFSSDVGGLIGYWGSGNIADTYAIGAVNGAGASRAGGLIGENGASQYGTQYTLTSSYFDTDTTGQDTSSGGTPESDAAMQTQATFAGWDFANIWQISPKAYPTLLALSGPQGGIGDMPEIPAAGLLPVAFIAFAIASRRRGKAKTGSPRS